MNVVEILTSIKLPVFFLILFLLLLSFCWQRAFNFFRFKSYEGKQRVHLNEIPRLGGFLIFTFLIFVVFIDFEQSSLLCNLLISSVPILMVGIKEDIFHNTSNHARLIGMTLSVILFFTIHPMIFPKIDLPILGEIISNYYVGLPFFLFASLVIINGTNLIDGMNGLMAFSTLSQLVALLFLTVLSADYEISKVIVLLIIPILIFLFFNFPLGRIFIGDFGAYFIGFTMSMIVIIFFGRNPQLLSWNAVLILFYPSIELLFSFIRKIFIDKIGSQTADNKHLHTLLFNYYKKRFLSVSIANNLTSLSLVIFWAAPLLIFVGADDFFFIISSIILLGVSYVIFYYYLRQLTLK